MKRLWVLASSLDRKKQLWLIAIAGSYLLTALLRGSGFSLAALGLITLCFFCELLDSSLGMGFGQGRGFALDLLMPVLAGALLSVPFSTEFVKHIDEGTLKRMIAILTFVLGIFTILKVLL
jgi:uncharacterized membrane protein YfcA